SILGVPVDLGAGRRGVDMGPSAIRYAGLKECLSELGFAVRDLGNIAVPLAEQIEAPSEGEPLRYLDALVTINRLLAQQMIEIRKTGAFRLIFGGVDVVAIGPVAGGRQGRRSGLLWIDAHADFNTAETTPSGDLHGMSVAALTGRGHPALTHLWGEG